MKISPGAYIFQRPFLRGLFLEGLIFGGAYLRREICVSKSVGLALRLEVNLPFQLCFTLYLREIFQVQTLYLEGRFNGGFLAVPVCGAYTWRSLFSEFYDNCLFTESIKKRKVEKGGYPFLDLGRPLYCYTPYVKNENRRRKAPNYESEHPLRKTNPS